eukprot:maker-scaffold97_size377342-snap-gene-0.10 protein:Tk12110 transcript:maker-scaffold97_size377342-snap-gene-0.10-mRNA-1 annotation:"lrrx1_dicdi ame: full"
MHEFSYSPVIHPKEIVFKFKEVKDRRKKRALAFEVVEHAQPPKRLKTFEYSFANYEHYLGNKELMCDFFSESAKLLYEYNLAFFSRSTLGPCSHLPSVPTPNSFSAVPGSWNSSRSSCCSTRTQSPPWGMSSDVLSTRDEEISSKSAQISELLAANEQLSRLKVSLEMRGLELEEQRDKVMEDRQEYEIQIKRLEGHLKDQAAPTKALEEKLASIQRDHSALKEIHSEIKERFKQNEVELIEKCDQLEQNEGALKELEKLLLAKNVEMAESFGRFAEKDQQLAELVASLEATRARCQEEEAGKLEARATLEAYVSSNRLDELQSQLEKLQNTVTTLNQGIEGKNSEIADLHYCVEQLTDDAEETRDELLAKVSELEEALSKTDDLRESLVQSQEAVKDLEARVVELSDRPELEKDILHLKKGLAEQDDVILSKNENIADLEEQICELKDKLSENEDVSAQVQELEALIVAKDQQLAELVASLEATRARCQEEETGKLEAGATLEAYVSSNRLDELQSQLEKLQNTVTTLNQEIEDKNSEIADLHYCVEQLNDDAEESRDELLAKVSELEKAQSKTGELRDSLVQSQEAVKDSEARVVELSDQPELEKDILQLKKDLAKQDDVILSKNENIADLEEQICELKDKLSENEDVNAQVQELEALIEAKDHQMAELESQLGEYEDVKEQVLQLHLDLQNHSEEIASQTAVIDDLKDTLKETKDDILEKEKLINNYQDQINAMEDQLSESSGLERVNELLKARDEEVQKLEAQVGTLIRSKDEAQQMRLDIQNYREEISSLTEKLTSVKTEKHQLSTQISVRENELQDSIAKVQELEELASESALKQEYVQRTSSPSSRGGSESNIKEQLSREFTAVQGELMSKSEALSRSQVRIREQEEEIGGNRAKIEELEESLAASEKEKLAMYDQLNTLSEQTATSEPIVDIQESSSFNPLGQALASLRKGAQMVLESEASPDEPDAKETINVLEGRIKVLEMEIDDNMTLVKDLKAQNETLQAQKDKLHTLHESVRDNYNSLLANQGDQKDVIKERDTIKTKYAALTDKARKLIGKCKQLDEQLQTKGRALSDVQGQYEIAQGELNEFRARVQAQEDEQRALRAKVETLEDNIDNLESNLKIKTEEAEKWQTEAMEKKSPVSSEALEALTTERDYLKEGVRDAEATNEKLTHEIVDLKEELEVKETAEDKFIELEDDNDRLKEERTDMYEKLIVLRDEIAELQKERVRLNSALEDARKEIGAIRQSQIVSQMLDSPLLRSAPSRGCLDPETSSVQAEAGSTIQEDEDKASSQKNLGEYEDGWSQDGWCEDESQIDPEEVGHWADEDPGASPPPRPIAPIERDEEKQTSPRPPQAIKEEEGFGGFSENDDGWEGGWEEEEVVIPEEVARPPTPQQPLSLGAVSSASGGPLKPELEADIEDGWGDDSWGGGWGEAAEEHLGDNLKLTDDDGLRTSEDRRASCETTPTESVPNWESQVAEKEAQIQALEHSLQALRLKVTTAEETVKTTEGLKDSALAEVEQIAAQLVAKDEAMKKLVDECEQRVVELEITQSSASNCKEKLEITDNMIEDYKERIDELTNEQQSLQIELEECYLELEKLRPLKNVRNELEEAEEKIQSLEEYKEELQSETSKLEDDLQLAETELQNVNEHLETVEADRIDLKSKVTELAKREGDLGGQVEELQVLLNSQEAELSSLKLANEELESTFSSLTERNDELVQDLDQKENQVEALQRQLETYGTTLEQAEVTKNHLQDQISNLQRLIQEKELESATTYTDLENEKATYEVQIETYKVDSKTMTDEISSLREEILRADQAEQALELQLRQRETNLQGREQNLSQALETRSNECARLQADLQESHARITELQQSLQALQEQRQIEQQMEPPHVDQEAAPGVGMDLAESNRPPPDVTYQNRQPDVMPAPSIGQPDIMKTSQDQFDLVAGQHGEWLTQEHHPVGFFNNPEPMGQPPLGYFPVEPPPPQAVALDHGQFPVEQPPQAVALDRGQFPVEQPPQAVGLDHGQFPVEQPPHQAVGLDHGQSPPPPAREAEGESQSVFSNYFQPAAEQPGLQDPVDYFSQPSPGMSTSHSHAEMSVPSASDYFNQPISGSHTPQIQSRPESAQLNPVPLSQESATSYFEPPQALLDAYRPGGGSPFQSAGEPLLPSQESVAATGYFNQPPTLVSAEADFYQQNPVMASEPQLDQSPEHVTHAASYFSQAGDGNAVAPPVSQAPGTVPALVAELPSAGPVPSESDLAQCQAQLAEYQQAIADWQTWAESQGQEQVKLQASLEQYTQAYNEATSELEHIKAEISEKSSDQELDKLVSRLRTTELEVKDLNETIDRLQYEKTDLDQEILDLTRSNEVLRAEKDDLEEGGQDGVVELAIFEEAKNHVDELTEERNRLSQELFASQEEKKHLEWLKESNLEAIQKLQDEANDIRNEKSTLLIQVTEFEATVSAANETVDQMESDKRALMVEIETINKTLDDLTQTVQQTDVDKIDVAQFNEVVSEKTELESQVTQITQELEQLRVNAPDPGEKDKLEAMEKDLKAAVDREEAMKTEFAEFQQTNDVSQYQQAIADWQTWAETQGQEFAKLQENLQQYTEGYQALTSELETLKAESNQSQEKSDEMVALKASLEADKLALEAQLNETREQLEVSSTQTHSEQDQMKEQAKKAIEERNAYELQLQDLERRFKDVSDELEKTRGQKSKEAPGSAEENQRLNVRIGILRSSFSQMEAKCGQLQAELAEMNALVATLQSDKNHLSETVDQLTQEKELLQNVEVDHQRLKAEHESVKLRLEALESEKMGPPSGGEQSSVQDYAAFQELNKNLQVEIHSLRTYIQQQQTAFEALQGSSEPNAPNVAFERSLLQQMEQDLQAKDQAMNLLEQENEHLKLRLSGAMTPASLEVSSLVPSTPERKRSSFSPEVSQILEGSAHHPLFTTENDRLRQDLDKSVRENRHLTTQMENWKKQLSDSSQVDDYDEDDESPNVLKAKQEQAWRSVGALQLRVEELTLEVTKLLEERDTLQLKLSNALRQYERQKESSSRASTARSTPIPWMDNSMDIRELRSKIDELSKLNYTKDVELQKQRQQMDAMQVRIRHHSTSFSGTPTRTEPQSRDPRCNHKPVHAYAYICGPLNYQDHMFSKSVSHLRDRLVPRTVNGVLVGLPLDKEEWSDEGHECEDEGHAQGEFPGDGPCHRQGQAAHETHGPEAFLESGSSHGEQDQQNHSDGEEDKGVPTGVQSRGQTHGTEEGGIQGQRIGLVVPGIIVEEQVEEKHIPAHGVNGVGTDGVGQLVEHRSQSETKADEDD